MTGENSLRIKRGLIVLISIMLAAHRGLYHARVRSPSASPLYVAYGTGLIPLLSRDG
jgi:hypothetical protein